MERCAQPAACYGDVTGKELPWDKVKAARKEEMDYYDNKGGCTKG